MNQQLRLHCEAFVSERFDHALVFEEGFFLAANNRSDFSFGFAKETKAESAGDGYAKHRNKNNDDGRTCNGSDFFVFHSTFEA